MIVYSRLVENLMFSSRSRTIHSIFFGQIRSKNYTYRSKLFIWNYPEYDHFISERSIVQFSSFFSFRSRTIHSINFLLNSFEKFVDSFRIICLKLLKIRLFPNNYSVFLTFKSFANDS